jgi:hypothetical protein
VEGYHTKCKAYCPGWREVQCIHCGEKLIPNIGTKRLITACFLIGFLLGVILSWLTPWDRLFDLLFALFIAIPYLMNRQIFAETDGFCNTDFS